MLAQLVQRADRLLFDQVVKLEPRCCFLPRYPIVRLHPLEGHSMAGILYQWHIFAAFSVDFGLALDNVV